MFCTYSFRYAILIVFFINNADSTSKLLPRVLLPVFKDVSVSFTLSVPDDGCYEWSLSRHDLISLQPVYDSKTNLCAKSALLTVLTKDFTRSSLKILAKSLDQEVTLVAHVIIDEISSLRIFSKTRQLYLEEPFQMFQVRGYDSQGNEFTTLEGIEFLWTTQNVYSNYRMPVLRTMTFAGSPHTIPPSMITLDNMGKHGYLALFEGIQTGLSKIKVQLPHPEYSHVTSTEIQVIVVENIELVPSTAFLLPGEIFEFKLFQIRNGKRTEIDLNSEKYKLVSQDSNIALITMKRKVFSKSLGKVEIVVNDIQMTDKPGISSLQLPTALVVVANPHYMTLTILPFNSWSIITNQQATIVPEIFSEDNHKFSFGETTVINTKVPEDIYYIHVRSQNGSVTGTTLEGSGLVSAELEKPILPRRIYAENMLYIYPKLSVTPDVLFLPWIAKHTPKLIHYTLHASGGDNDYTWSSSDPSIVQVSQSGNLKFVGPGSATVSVSMKKNKYNFATANVHLLIPQDIAILKSAHEVEIRKEIDVHIAVYGVLQDENQSHKILFSTCDYLDFVITPEHPFISAGRSSAKPLLGACAVTSLKSIDEGRGKVIVGLETDECNLFTNSLYYSFRQLSSIQPFYDNNVVLTVGSAFDVVFSGGPEPFFGHIERTISYGNKIFSFEEKVMFPGLYVIRLTCMHLGSSYLQLTLKTKPWGFSSVKIVSKVLIFCEVPKTVEVVGNFKAGCPETSQRIVAYPSNSIQLNVKIFDYKGRIFKNATSVFAYCQWENKKIASFVFDDKVLLKEIDNLFYVTPLTHYTIALTHNETGDVPGKCVLFRAQNRLYEVSTSFLLSVVQEPSVEPSFLTLFNHPNHVGNLHLKGGSGHFNFELVPPSFAVVKYIFKSRTAEVSPHREGSGELVITDKCMPHIHPIRIDVQVVSVFRLDISGPSKIEEGQSCKITIRLFDRNDKPMPIPATSLQKLGIKFEISNPSLAEFGADSKATLDCSRGLVEVNLKGKKIGQASIWAQLKEITSNNHNIQVFPRLKVTPSNLTVVVGSEYQITVTGGPPTDSYIHFVPADPSITTVFPGAIVKGWKSGSTTVTVMAVGYQGEIYCKDTIEVHVINLQGVNIVAPIYKLGVGNTMPAWAIGIPHSISPLLLASISPPLQFKWRVSVPNIIQIHDTLLKTNIQVPPDSRLSVRLYGLNPGRTDVELQVFMRNEINKSFLSFNSSITITVFNLLEWTRPNANFKSLLMAPNSEYQLRTNAPVDEEHMFRTLDSSSHSIISVSRDGLMMSGSLYGSAVVETSTMLANIPQTIFQVFQVKPVHYIMINVGTVLETSEDMKSLPRGLYLSLNISYHDQYGTEFLVPPFTKPSYECNICSKIQVEYIESNHSLITNLATAGSVVLRVFDHFKHIEMEDFVKIPVDNYILPNKPYLTVGEVICFWTPLVNSLWSTDDGKILNIHKNGIAIAERSGITSVTFSISKPEPLILASISVEILPLQAFLIGPSTQKSITNLMGQTYSFPVFLINEKTKREPYYSRHCNSTDFNIYSFPFQCELHYTSASKFFAVEKIFSVYEDFDFIRGSFVCVISPIKGASREISVVESNLTLTVTNRRSIYDTFFLNFHPQFTLSSDKIYLSKEYNSGYISVFGSSAVLASLYVEPSRHRSVSVQTSLDKYDALSVIVRLDTTSFDQEEEISITISSQLTQQEAKVVILISSKLDKRYFSTMDIIVDFFADGIFMRQLPATVIVYTVLAVSIALFYNHYKLTIDPNFLIEATPEEYNAFIPRNPRPSRMSSKGLRSNVGNTFSFREYSVSRPLMASPTFIRTTAPYLRSVKSSYVPPVESQEREHGVPLKTDPSQTSLRTSSSTTSLGTPLRADPSQTSIGTSGSLTTVSTSDSDEGTYESYQ